ncbi:MAG: hypothetical protein ABI759_28525 [Candidatus Solibacter sp.]
MATTPATVNGPIELMDNNGKLLSLSVSDVFFNNGSISAKGAIYAANQALFDPFLKHLVTTGFIKPGPTPATKPVMVLKAKTAGSNGNAIGVQFTNFSSDASPKFDATVSEVETYTGLTGATIQSVLGTSATNGKRRGLVFVPGAAPAATVDPKAGVYALAIAGAATAATADIPLNAGAGTAFTLQAKGDGADGSLTTAEVKDVDTTAHTFSIVAKWSKTAAQVLPAGLTAAFGYEVDIAAPPGGSLGTPAPGSAVLSGGADASDALQASGTAAG